MLLESERMRQLMMELHDRFECVVIDTSPLGVSSDAFSLINQVSGVVVVGALGRSTFDSAQRMTRLLEFQHANVLGVVANLTASRARVAGAYYTDPV
jgi:Mrp family chromosome partitioning ATPase